MRKFLLPAAALLLAFSASFADNHESTEVDRNATLDLTELFPTVEAWDAARKEVLAEFPKIEARKGTLGDSAESLYDAMALISDTSRKGARDAGPSAETAISKSAERSPRSPARVLRRG